MHSDYPTSIPGTNNHRLVLFSPDQRRPDFERLQDIAADATAALRGSLETVHELIMVNYELFERDVEVLRRHCDQGTTVGEAFCADLDACIERAWRIDARHDPALETFLAGLRETRRLARRVSDLIAADKAIGRLMRGRG